MKEMETNNKMRSELYKRGESGIGPTEPQLWNIIFKNAFYDKVRRLDPNKPSLEESFEMWGLWLLPSYINHSCTPNCHRMRVGDAVFIRAATDIAAGEELTLPYFDIFGPLLFLKRTCDTFGFRCDCRQCVFERSIGKAYYDIANTILEVRFALQVMWRENNTDQDGLNWLLFVLQDLQGTATDLAREKVQSDQKNKRTSSAQHESRSNSCPEVSDLEKMQIYWIGALFIDIQMASLTLALTESYRLGDSFLSQGSRSSETEETGKLTRISTIAKSIVEVISKVHPGNVLGQEILLMWFKAFKTRVAEFTFSEDFAAQVDDMLKTLEQNDIPWFCQRYYGFPGDETLKMLVATES